MDGTRVDEKRQQWQAMTTTAMAAARSK